MANITASSFVQNVKSYSTMPSLDSSAANLATRSILAKMPRSLLQALYATKDVRGHALRGPSHAMAPPHCRHTAYAKSLTEMV